LICFALLFLKVPLSFFFYHISEVSFSSEDYGKHQSNLGIENDVIYQFGMLPAVQKSHASILYTFLFRMFSVMKKAFDPPVGTAFLFC